MKHKLMNRKTSLIMLLLVLCGSTLAATNKPVHIQAITGDYGFKKCSTDYGEMFVSGLPADTIRRFAEWRKLELEIAEYNRLRAAGVRAKPPVYAVGSRRRPVAQERVGEVANVYVIETGQVYAGLKVHKYVRHMTKPEINKKIFGGK